MKLPSFQFYPGDWMKDPALRLVSVSARGLWMDILCLMFESPQRGFLEHQNGKPIAADQLARVVGERLPETRKLLKELEDAGVYSVDERGVIFSRRMVREEQNRIHVSEERSRAGKKGMANRWGTDNKSHNKPDNKSITAEVAKHNSSSSLSSSSSSSTSSSTLSPESPADPGSAVESTEPRERGTRFTIQERRQFAEARGLRGGWLHLSADGRYDDQIADFLSGQAVDVSDRGDPQPSNHRSNELASIAEDVRILVEVQGRGLDDVLVSQRDLTEADREAVRTILTGKAAEKHDGPNGRSARG
jgi:hypothetical protein